VSRLVLTPNFGDGDRFYERLMDLHRDLTDAESSAANARLILLLANHIGDQDVLEQALELAGEDIRPD
jgi:hypothetical protein